MKFYPYYNCMIKKEKISILFVNLHGLFRGERLELGRDADTGGQTRYVLDLAKALGGNSDVEITVLTRLIKDKTVSTDYSKGEETLALGGQGEGPAATLTILRVPFGGNRYVRKEQLWPHLDEAADQSIKLLRQRGTIPHFVHGHYADGGYVAMQLARVFGIPLGFTGHSLGLLKKSRLMAEGHKEAELEKRFNFSKRISAEEEILANADLVVTSTQHEIDTQYALYPSTVRESFSVIPPGFGLDRFIAFYDSRERDSDEYHNAMAAHVALEEELARFFIEPDKPLIVSVCRPDKRKNISGLIEVFGEHRDLRAMANLAIFAGIRKDISTMESAEKDVLVEMLLLMDKYDLYGSMAIPKKHDVTFQIPELYRIAAERHGAMVNLSLNENFGLTLLEAAASGLPVVATKNGGPVDIVERLQNGIIVDPEDHAEAASALRDLLTDRDRWTKASNQGVTSVRRYYTWEAHVESYLKRVKPLTEAMEPKLYPVSRTSNPIGKRLGQVEYIFISDIDNTLIGGEEESAQELSTLLRTHSDRIAFAVCTGRPLIMAQEAMDQWSFPRPEILITSVGTEIYYDDTKLLPDRGWASHLSFQWNPDGVRHALEGIEGLELQEDEAQRKFKVSYYYGGKDKDIMAAINHRLQLAKLRFNVIDSHGTFIDILPTRASKGKAVRYLCHKWGLPYKRIITAGDSGNDRDMLQGALKGILVGNRSAELDELKSGPYLYKAQGGYSAGVLEGLRHYGVI